MLHLIFQSSLDTAVLHRIKSEDDVIFLENAVFRVNVGTVLTKDIQHMIDKSVHLYVLNDELESRGISKSELVSGVKVIDYSGFVKLAEKNKISCSWS